MPAKVILHGFLRIFFQLLYNQFAWTYDWVAAIVSVGMWGDWVRSVLPYMQGQRVLEMGHGPGHLQEALNQPGREDCLPFGLDLSRSMGQIACRNLRKQGFPIRLVRGQGQQLPFASHCFQRVVATFPTEYMMYPETLSEIYRVLSPDGALVVLAAAWITGGSLFQRMAAWLFRFTGQVPEEDPRLDPRMLQPAIDAGFKVRFEWLDQKASKLLLVIAEKKN